MNPIISIIAAIAVGVLAIWFFTWFIVIILGFIAVFAFVWACGVPIAITNNNQTVGHLRWFTYTPVYWTPQ